MCFSDKMIELFVCDMLNRAVTVTKLDKSQKSVYRLSDVS